MSAVEATSTVPLRRDEYERLVEAGALDDQRVELLDGRKVSMSPESAEHAAIIDIIVRRLGVAAEAAGMWIRIGHPLALSEVDEPEPDIAVVDDREDRYRHGHPTPDETHLLIEVAYTSLRKDVLEKATRYAHAGIADYWVVDLAARRVTLHREPEVSTARFLSLATVAFGQGIAPLALPDALVTLD